MMERVLSKDERAFKNMEAIAKMLTAVSKNGYEYKVEDCYLDYGQGWMWTTITYESEYGGVQILSPREWEAVFFAETPSDLMEIINGIMSDQYFGDK